MPPYLFYLLSLLATLLCMSILVCTSIPKRTTAAPGSISITRASHQTKKPQRTASSRSRPPVSVTVASHPPCTRYSRHTS
ncbi:hypothetical protein GGI42DRAFT_328368 [Trichoderma sp. SZMC 28013]